MNWRPISEYIPEMGRVIVWLEWPAYSRVARNLEREGMYVHAYCIEAADRGVWVSQHDCIPIETTGRSVTHFMQPMRPENGNGESNG